MRVLSAFIVVSMYPTVPVRAIGHGGDHKMLGFLAACVMGATPPTPVPPQVPEMPAAVLPDNEARRLIEQTGRLNGGRLREPSREARGNRS